MTSTKNKSSKTKPVRRRGRPVEMGHPWCELIAKLGGIQNLLKHLGVHQTTLNRWGSASKLRPSVVINIKRLCDEYGIEIEPDWGTGKTGKR